MHRHRLYIIGANGRPQWTNCQLSWARWIRDQRPVAFTQFDDCEITTSFTGIDVGVDGRDGMPILWETAVFNGSLDGELQTYHSLEAALDGHARIVKRVWESRQ